MKNKIFKILSLLLSFVLLFCYGCSCNKEEETVENNTIIIEEDGRHNVSETENFLINDGNSDYKIVYPSGNTSSIISLATNELQNFINQSCGKKLSIVSDDTSLKLNSKYISIGETSLLKNSGIYVDKENLTKTGYIIKTIDEAIYIAGGSVYGVISGVYDFLRTTFNFECYATDEIVIETGVKNKKLYNYDIEEIPDIPWLISASGELMNDGAYARRLGYNAIDDFTPSFGGEFIHNFTSVVSYEENFSSHNDWFWKEDTLCLTRDAEGLSDYVVSKMKEFIIAHPDADALGWTQEDNGAWCECDKCKAMKEQYDGCNSASLIKFMNLMWSKLEPWLEENYKERKIYLYCCAYQATTDAPATKQSDGTYKPIDDTVKLNENIYVEYAPIYAAAYHVYSSKFNTLYDETMKKWNACASRIMCWTYSYYYKNKNYPYFDFYDMQKTYKYLVSNGVEYLFDEDTNGCAIWMDWSRLKLFLRAKLGKNVNADLTKLTNDFFANYYKVASTTMKQIFDEYCLQYSKIINENDITGECRAMNIDKSQYWPKGLLDSWMRLLDKAYEDIAFLKTSDKALYDKLYYRITLDSLSLRYLSEKIYKSCIFTATGNSVAKDALTYGISLDTEA